MEEELMGIKNAALSFIMDAQDLKELEETKLQFLGRSGRLTIAIKEISKLPDEKRPDVGRLANEVKKTIEEALDERKSMLSDKHVPTSKKIDVTNPGIEPEIGHMHAVTQVLQEAMDIFKTLGFQIAEGPEIEKDFYNFEALNLHKDHPARDTQQSLYLDTGGSKVNPGEIILRTQTTNLLPRVLEKTKPPVRVVTYGKVYRYEQVDASHGFEFWQIDGFILDETTNLDNLFGTLSYFLKKFFGEGTKVKYVAHNFPFVEPGGEAYVTCLVCKGKGCRFCKQSGWVEVLGCGMIHPNVLKSVGVNSQKYQGFAFGMGFSRMVTLKYQMDDLRLLTNPDIRILKQF